MCTKETALIQVFLHSQAFRWLATATNLLWVNDWTLYKLDSDGIRHVATISVWLRWIVFAMCLFQLVYRTDFGLAKYVVYVLLLTVLVASNAYLHYRVASSPSVTWHWVFALFLVDLSLVSGAIITAGGFSHFFFHELYYPFLRGSP